MPPSAIQGERTSQHKSRNGCITCKQKRVKCNEGHPRCLRCIDTGITCRYVTNTPQVTKIAPATIGGRKAKRVLLPKREEALLGLTSFRPSATLLGETDVENRYLRYFQQETTSGFQSAWDWSVWNRLMLQASHQEAFIRDAVIAIGALHKSLRTASSTGSDQEHTDQLAQLQRQFAYRTYGRALKRIQQAIDEGSDPQDALMACLLIVCFESHSGDRYKAMLHAQHGLRIYHQMKNRPYQVEDEIVDAFHNLDIQISTCHDGRTIETHKQLLDQDNVLAASMPLAFTNLQEAKRYWQIVMRRCCHFIPAAGNHVASGSYARPFKTQNPGGVVVSAGSNIWSLCPKFDFKIQIQQAGYYDEVERWITAFEPMLRRIRRGANNSVRDYATATMLQIQALNTKIILAGMVYVSEMDFDDHYEDFASIIKLSHDIVRIRNAGSPISYFSGLFTLDLGIVVPLFTLLMKCRSRVFRYQALEILKDWHVEGWWDPQLIYAMCKCLIDVEEEGMVGEEIPEESRVILTSKCHAPPERRLLVQFMRRGKSGLEWVERWAEW
ncbi:hypothetical protein GRF29_19g1177605 [Pseudopithomyces chartarum]|uniref:Zn(2)-C6 fungal-type domain-containing protein n=1 Tax=Pseudopithomyces chartarum TaxID=1892770 RepID=A0AAN6M2T7_9PLEO|nr:hypothetical protein GRF29_19g1177605 [Pseudopithomyces chartarum]